MLMASVEALLNAATVERVRDRRDHIGAYGGDLDGRANSLSL